MKITGSIVLIATFISVTILQVANADESITEKISVTSNDARRGLKKGVHRVQEALCVKGDLECAASKAKNRVTEAGDIAADAASKIKNKID